jgi:hypothetical protein
MLCALAAQRRCVGMKTRLCAQRRKRWDLNFVI